MTNPIKHILLRLVASRQSAKWVIMLEHNLIYMP